MSGPSPGQLCTSNNSQDLENWSFSFLSVMPTRTPSSEPDLDVVSESTFDCGSASVRSISSDSEEATPKRHPDYFFPDGNLYVQVQDTIYRVHNYFLTSYSSYFDDLVSPFTTNAAQTSGSTEEDPLCVDPDLEVTASEFSQLLWVFYDETFERNASGDQWMDILLTAEKFKMDSVCLLAVKNLKSLSFEYDAIAKISVQQRYLVPLTWARQAYVDACLRPERLSEAEGEDIGLAAAMMIARVQGELTNVEDSSRLAVVDAAVDCFFREQAPPETPELVELLDHDEPYNCDVEEGVLQIEGDSLIFNVHRYFIERHSSVLRPQLATSTPSILLNSCMSDLHFSWLLWAIYDRGLTVSASSAQWNAIRLGAEILGMDKLCAAAIKQIRNSLDLIDLIVVTERSNAKGDWVDEAWDTLRQRSSPLTKDEWQRLGASTLSAVAKVAGAREERMWLEIQRLTAIVEEMKSGKT